MKKYIITVIALLLISTISYADVSETSVSTWTVLDTTTSDGNEPNDLAADERTYSAVESAISTAASGDGDDEISIVRINRTGATKSKTNVIRFRCIGITDNANVVHDIYSGTLGNKSNCNLTYLGQLDWTIGQQASTTDTYEMADQVSVTQGDTTVDWNSESAADDRVAEAVIDLQGSDILVIVPSTSACDSKLLGKGY